MSLIKQKEYRKNTLAISKLNNLFNGSVTIGNEDINKYINDLNNKDELINGETILYKACKYLNKKSAYVVKLLLDNGADPDIGDNNGNTPLISVTNQFKVQLMNEYQDIVNEIVNDLVKYNADIGKTNKYNKNALYYACMYNMSDVALTLLNTGKSNPCANGETLFYACENRMEDVAIRIIEYCPELTNTIYKDESIYDIAKKK